MVCALCNNTENLTQIGENLYICDKCQHKFFNELHYANKDNIQGINLLVEGTNLVLKGLHDLYGIDITNDNFRDTPKRVARLLMEMNYGTNIEAAKDVLSASFPTNNNYTGLISSNNIKVFSLCPHHCLPVEYDVSIAYIPAPEGKCVGLSKLPRLAKILAKSMLLQEEYTKKLVDTLNEIIKPSGCAALVTGVHNCVQCRGVEMVDVHTTTISLEGIFMANPSLKDEWLFTIKK